MNHSDVFLAKWTFGSQKLASFSQNWALWGKNASATGQGFYLERNALYNILADAKLWSQTALRVYMITGPPGVGKSEFTIWIAGARPSRVSWCLTNVGKGCRKSTFLNLFEHFPMSFFYPGSTKTPEKYFWSCFFSFWTPKTNNNRGLFPSFFFPFFEPKKSPKQNNERLRAPGQLGIPVYRLCLSSPRLSDDRLAQSLGGGMGSLFFLRSFKSLIVCSSYFRYI